MEDKKVTIELPVAAWNVVMNALGQRPFAEVVEVVGAIRAQADQQLAAAAPAQPVGE